MLFLATFIKLKSLLCIVHICALDLLQIYFFSRFTRFYYKKTQFTFYLFIKKLKCKEFYGILFFVALSKFTNWKSKQTFSLNFLLFVWFTSAGIFKMLTFFRVVNLTRTVANLNIMSKNLLLTKHLSNFPNALQSPIATCHKNSNRM